MSAGATTRTCEGRGHVMIDPELLDILVCPETKQPVEPAADELVERLNDAIRRGELRDRSGDTVRDALDGGLVREDGTLLYPVRDDIPVMLIDEAIPLDEGR